MIAARRIVTGLALVLRVAGCHHRDPEIAGRTVPPPRPAPTTAPAVSEPAAPAYSSFQRDILPVLVGHCANAKGCHGEEPTESVNLDLRPPAAFTQLVNAVSQARRGSVRVKPGDDEASFLVAKLTGRLVGQEGKPMPIDPESGFPIVPSPLPPEFIDKVLRPWIRAGAPNN